MCTGDRITGCRGINKKKPKYQVSEIAMINGQKWKERGEQVALWKKSSNSSMCMLLHRGLTEEKAITSSTDFSLTTLSLLLLVSNPFEQ